MTEFQLSVAEQMKKVPAFRGVCSFLSNFHQVNIMWNGICFWGVEHLFYYITRKTEDERERIYACDNQSISVRAKNTKLRPDWDDIKIDFMKEMLRAKFHQGGRKLA